MSRLVLLVVAWICSISYRNGVCRYIYTVDCWPYTCCFFWTVGSPSKYSKSKSFCRYYFSRFLFELAELIPRLYSHGSSICYFYRFNDFAVTIPKCCKNIYFSSFFPRTARLWSSLTVECFSLRCDINSLNPGLTSSCYHWVLCSSDTLFTFVFFLVTPWLVVAFQSCMELIPIKIKTAKFAVSC